MYNQIIGRALALMGDGSRIARLVCHIALQHQSLGLPAVAGLRLVDILPLPISTAAGPAARGCKDHASLFRLMVGIHLRAHYQRAVREIIQDPAEFGRFFLYQDSPTHCDIESRLVDDLLARNQIKTIGELLVLSENSFGFFEYEPDDPALKEQWQSPEAVLRRDGATGVEEEVSFFFDTEETGTLDLRFVWARSFRGAECIAVALGYLIQPRRDDLSDADFHSTCYAHSERLTEFSYYALLQHGGVKELFQGGGVFYLRHWEVTQAERGKGLGASLLNGTLRAIADRNPQIRTIAVDLAPGQYAYPLPAYRPPDLRARYEADRRQLRSYWDRLAPHRLLSSAHGRTLHLTVLQLLTFWDEQDILASYAARGPERPYH